MSVPIKMPDTSLNSDDLKAARQSLDECVQTLEKVSETCCTYERSPQMEGAFHELQKASDALNNSFKNPEKLSACVDSIAECGRRIVALKVSCCTETREPLYNQILQGLNKAHEDLFRTPEKE